MKDQLKGMEKDLSEFKDIHKRYTDQLIKVKVRMSLHCFSRSRRFQMSDMANNDLEKYAKALDK